MVEVVTVDTPQLGNRAYIVHDQRHALVVDPPRDIDRVERAAEEAGVEIDAVAETHVHNDYVSGGPALARRHGAQYLVAAAERVAVSRAGVQGGDVLGVGGLEVEVIATPGHTPHHLAYLATAAGAAQAEPALFSGGSLLYGTVGRTDLAGPEHTEALTREQYRSAHRLAERLPARTGLFPTHGFGSFCASSTAVDTARSRLATELGDNTALTVDDEDTFVERLLAGFGPVPSYYDHMADLNRAGHGLTQAGEPRILEPDDVRAAVAGGAWVVDLRGRRDFAAGHLRGSLSVEYGSTCATYIGWTVPWGADIVLLADSESRIAAAGRDLARIGIDRPAGAVLTPQTTPTTDRHAFPVGRWEDLKAALAEDGDPADPPVVLDVRQRAEYEDGHLPGALSVPVQRVADHVEAVPPGEVWVHCRSGYRAALSASLLHAAGRRVVLVDDEWERAVDVGLPVDSGAPVAALY